MKVGMDPTLPLPFLLGQDCSLQVVGEFAANLAKATEDGEKMAKSKDKHQVWYTSESAQCRKFQPGDMVLVLVPTTEFMFLALWPWPYEVIGKLSNISLLKWDNREEGNLFSYLYHMNLCKKLHVREAMFSVSGQTQLWCHPLKMSRSALSLQPCNKQDLFELITNNRDLFLERPGHTQVIQHYIYTKPGKKVLLPVYRVHEARRDMIKNEVDMILRLGIIEKSHSEWSSQIYFSSKTWWKCAMEFVMTFKT